MNISVEVSYYPLKAEYKAPIKDFIARVNKHEGLKVETNHMSTQIFGDYHQVMQALTQEIYKSFELPHSIFVMKIINADLR